jgi:RHS repeat-associated protein
MYDCSVQHAPWTHKFTGKERDTESGLDNFGARYMGSSLGRFMTPDWAAKPTDVPYADFGNPKSLNLYSYVNNNPLSKADPDGHCAEDFCIVEGGVSAYFLGAAAVVGVAAVLHTPAGQRSLETFTSAAGANLTANFHAASQLAQNIFSSKSPEVSAATAGAKGAVETAEETNKEA